MRVAVPSAAWAVLLLLVASPLVAMRAPLESHGSAWSVDLIPVASPHVAFDAVTTGDLEGALIDPAITPAQRAALPFATRVSADPVAAALSGEVIALVPAGSVSPALKTLSLDGRFYWRADDRRDWPLRVPAASRGDPPTTWSIIAAGEIIFGRGVEERIETRHGGDATAAFAGVRDILRGADLAVATLEAPLSGNGNRWCDTCMQFIGNERYAGALADAGLDLVSLAANHIGDAGPAGVQRTIAALDGVGVAHAGAGPDARSAREPTFLSVHGARIAVLAYDDVPPESYWASGTGAGSNPLRHDDPTYASLRADIARARSAADAVIVLAHWGAEYEAAPRPSVVSAAHAMVEAGAAAVIGDHAHWVQSVEVYRGGYIAYGVGNFVFDQMWSEETRLGTLQELWFSDGRVTAARIHPTVIEDYYRPRLLRPDERAYDAVLQRAAPSVTRPDATPIRLRSASPPGS